jgi:membrane-associated protease RseP (regulator of RpoE activity)
MPFAAAGLLAAGAAVAVLASHAPAASAADEESGGRIVAISPDQEASLPEGENQDHADQAQPKYWIGLQGRPIDSQALRTQLQLADDVGFIVENLVPGSPAEKAGLRQHDIIVAVNGEPVGDVTALQKAVSQGDEKPIELKLLRLAKETTVSVTPEERPADAPSLPAQGEGLGAAGNIEDLLRQFQQGGMRRIGPGMVFNGQPFDVNQVPGGVSVSITKEGDGPANITVKKGDQTWTVKGDDAEALKQLPDDVRPFVQPMLQGARGGKAAMPNFNFGELQQLLPDQLGRFDAEGLDQGLRQRAAQARERTEQASQRLLQRLEQMEKRLEDLQHQLEQNPKADRTDHGDDSSK